ncbi:hypothetical protein C8T65DRAFT_537243, partial [Cerioporus squamosus]
PRKITLWNAFISKELKRMNAGEHDSDVEPQRVHNGVIKELSARWAAMTPDERQAEAGEELEKLVARQENRVKGVHNVQLHAFNDTRANLASVTRQLDELKGRTDNDFILLAVRSHIHDYNPPYVYYTNERVQDFFELVTKMPITDLAAKLEAHVISGVEGTTRNARQETVELKRQVKELIFDTLQESCTRTTIPKMFYINFEEHITMRYGIIVKNWPLKRFAAPGSLSRIELEVLLHAFKNKLTTFRQLDDEEWVDW